MFQKWATAISILGCVILVILILLEPWLHLSMWSLKPILWVTLIAFVSRLILRFRNK